MFLYKRLYSGGVLVNNENYSVVSKRPIGTRLNFTWAELRCCAIKIGIGIVSTIAAQCLYKVDNFDHQQNLNCCKNVRLILEIFFLNICSTLKNCKRIIAFIVLLQLFSWYLGNYIFLWKLWRFFQLFENIVS